jgi:hypothetical protein
MNNHVPIRRSMVGGPPLVNICSCGWPPMQKLLFQTPLSPVGWLRDSLLDMSRVPDWMNVTRMNQSMSECDRRLHV